MVRGPTRSGRAKIAVDARWSVRGASGDGPWTVFGQFVAAFLLFPPDVRRVGHRYAITCHQHLDHSGGNHEFPGVPVYIQRTELENARTPDFTYPQYTRDYPGAVLEVIDGEHELRDGLRIVPTPGHTTGHQALLVDTDDGVVMLAGQSAEIWSFGGAILSERLDHELGDRIGTYPEWASLLRERNVARAYLAHDLMIWERDQSQIGRPADE